MNKQLFKKYMMQGLGRCVLELRDPEARKKHIESVLRACKRNIAYDPQSEGVRARYVYEMTQNYSDSENFLSAAIDALNKLPRRNDWDFIHICELLFHFARNGSKTAEEALLAEYEKLVNYFMSDRRYRGYDHECYRLENISIILVRLFGERILPRIAHDLGAICRQKGICLSKDYDWLFTYIYNFIGVNKSKRILKNAGATDADAMCFFEEYIKPSDCIPQSEKPKTADPDADTIIAEINTHGSVSIASRLNFMRKASEDEKTRLYLAILGEEDPEKMADYISTLYSKPGYIPLNPAYIAECSRSDNEKLRNASFAALKNCKSYFVREYALELLEKGEHVKEAIPILITNYEHEDKTRLLAAVSSLVTDREDSSDWHDIGNDIINAYKTKVPLPKEFLLYVYETTRCSYCRRRAVSELAKHRWLTPDMIEECRHDSNIDTVNHMNRYYKKST